MPKRNFSNTIIYKLQCKNDSIEPIYGYTGHLNAFKFKLRRNCKNGKKGFVYETIAKNGGFENWDVIVSNPPFTNKRKFFERALSFNKPFALIMTNTWLNDSAPKQLFKDKDLQLLMFDKRMKFHSPDGRPNDKITFSSSYYCWNFLPKQIIMEQLNVPSGKLAQRTRSEAVLPL